MSENATRFLKAYNNLDYGLRVQYNFKRGMAFSDIIRRSVMVNSVIRKYEDELIDYGRLRNAIVHSGNSETIIAEPHLDIVEKLEHISSLITTPPKVLDTVCKKDVITIDGADTLEKTVALISKSGYSNLPVFENGTLIGVANGQRILDCIGEAIRKQQDLNTFLRETTIKMLLERISAQYFCVQSADLTLESALNIFYKNRKMLVILITKNGSTSEKLLGIITVADIMDINNILENF